MEKAKHRKTVQEEKCPKCGKTFRDEVPFAYPGTRIAAEEMVNRQTEQNAQETAQAAQDGQQNAQYSAREEDQLTEDKYYSSTIDKWDGTASGGRMKVRRIKEGSIYTAIGLPAGELYFDYSKAAAALSKHGDHLTKNSLKQIPQMLANPVVITEPINQQVKNTVNVFGEMMGENGKPIMVSIMMRPNRSNTALLDIIRTVEMRGDTTKLITEKSLLYLSENKKRTTNWFQGLGNSSVPFAGTKSGFIRSISYTSESVNGERQFARRDETQTEEFKRWFGNSEVTDDDGNPLVVYHSTFSRFTSFDPQRLGEGTDINASDGYIASTAHVGFWFNTQRLTDKGMGDTKKASTFGNGCPSGTSRSAFSTFAKTSTADFATSMCPTRCSKWHTSCKHSDLCRDDRFHIVLRLYTHFSTNMGIFLVLSVFSRK